LKEEAMKFLCLIRAEHLYESLAPTVAAQHFEEYRQFAVSARAGGYLLGGNRLLPPETATTVRVRDGRISATDGPYAETKEQLGGYFLIEAKDRQDATRVAAQIPGARIGSVEVRPVAEDEATRRVLEA
jgi:hypothetical protein